MPDWWVGVPWWVAVLILCGVALLVSLPFALALGKGYVFALVVSWVAAVPQVLLITWIGRRLFYRMK
jgi:hypothetical protein